METNFLALVALALGWLVARRILHEREPVLAGALAVLLGASAVLVAANAGLKGMEQVASIALPTLVLSFIPRTRYYCRRGRRLQRTLLVLATLAVTLHTAYAQLRTVDPGSWFHEPLVTSLASGQWPPQHPYFPGSTLQGRYGRDLLAAAFTAPGQDPLGILWGLNPILQTATFVLLVTSLRSLSGTFRAGFLAALCMFFGAAVGGQVGLVDSFMGDSGFVHALLILNLHLLFRLFRPADAGGAGPRLPWTSLLPRWLVTGLVLGIYPIVSTVHFGLVLLTGVTLGLVFRQRQVWAGLLVSAAVALALAATGAGPLSDLARQGATPGLGILSAGVAFPKERPFTVRLPEEFESAPPVARDVSLLSPRFLGRQGLPLFLAPFTLWLLWRQRSLPGLGLFFFGAVAFLGPGLVDLGPCSSEGLLRWELSAGVALAGALGLALAPWLPPQPGAPRPVVPEAQGRERRLPPGTLTATLALLVLALSLAPALRLLIRDAADAWNGRIPWDGSARHWRLRQPELRTSRADLAAAAWLAGRARPGQRFLSNRSDGTPTGLFADAVFATLSGAMPAGHAFPSGRQDAPCGPPFLADPLSRVFWATGRTELLSPAHVDWLLVDPERAGPDLTRHLQAAPDLAPGPLFRDPLGERRQLFMVRSGSVPEDAGAPARPREGPAGGEPL